MTKNSPAFQRMLEQDQERERMELARREQEFLNDRGVPPSGSGYSGVPSQKNATASRPTYPSRKK